MLLLLLELGGQLTLRRLQTRMKFVFCHKIQKMEWAFWSNFMRDKSIPTIVEDDTNCSGIWIFNLVETIMLILIV